MSELQSFGYRLTPLVGTLDRVWWLASGVGTLDRVWWLASGVGTLDRVWWLASGVMSVGTCHCDLSVPLLFQSVFLGDGSGVFLWWVLLGVLVASGAV